MTPPEGVHGEVHPAYAGLVEHFRQLFTRPGQGGGALAAYQHGRKVVDVWAGWADGHGGRPWQRDTLALSFSTTKGVVSTVLHRLADRGLLDYDEPVATYWPAFAAAGKQTVTVRDVLTHRAGLHDVRRLVDEPDEILDSGHMQDKLARAHAEPAPGYAPAYHAFTYGWLAAGLAEAVTGTSLRQLFARELAKPLGVDGLFLGAGRAERGRVARLFPRPWDFGRMTLLGGVASRLSWTRRFAEAMLLPGFHDLLFERGPEFLDAQIPAVNGVFTARAVARLYGALANGGEIDGTRLVSPSTLRRMATPQTHRRDHVLYVRMNWRLGYHRVLALGGGSEGFGHHGYGGSGGWADPDTGFALAFTSNRIASPTSPLVDLRLAGLNRHALRAARRVAGTAG